MHLALQVQQSLLRQRVEHTVLYNQGHLLHRLLQQYTIQLTVPHQQHQVLTAQVQDNYIIALDHQGRSWQAQTACREIQGKRRS